MMESATPEPRPVAGEAAARETGLSVSCLVHNVQGREFRAVVGVVFAKVS